MAEAIKKTGSRVGVCYWDGAAWQKLEADTLTVGSNLYYWDGAAWQKLEADSLKVQANNYGYDGAAWQKQPLIWSYSDTYSERIIVVADATSEVISGTAVVADQVWIVQSVCAWNESGNTTTIGAIMADVGANQRRLNQLAAPTRYVPITFHGQLVLKEADLVKAYFSGVAIGHILYLDIRGYKMAIA